jgi:AraC-like DNA-binding protein
VTRSSRALIAGLFRPMGGAFPPAIRQPGDAVAGPSCRCRRAHDGPTHGAGGHRGRRPRGRDGVPRRARTHAAGRPGACEYAQPLDVEALTRDAYLSAGHLSREFRTAYGESPYAYLMTRRIERAMTLVRRGTSPSPMSATRSAARHWACQSRVVGTMLTSRGALTMTVCTLRSPSALLTAESPSAASRRVSSETLGGTCRRVRSLPAT